MKRIIGLPIIVIMICSLAAQMLVAGAQGGAVPTASIEGPATIDADDGATATYTIHVKNLPESSIWLRIKLTVDAAYLEARSSAALNGFLSIARLDWVDAGGGKQQATASITRGSADYGDYDVFSVVFGIADITGPSREITASVEMEIEEFGNSTEWLDITYGARVANTTIIRGASDVGSEGETPSPSTAPPNSPTPSTTPHSPNPSDNTNQNQEYSRFDINQDGVVNLLDLNAAMGKLMVTDANAAWDELAARSDVNGDLRIDVADFTIIYLNVT